MRNTYLVYHRQLNDEPLVTLCVAESEAEARRYAKVPDECISEVKRVPMDRCGMLAVYYV